MFKNTARIALIITIGLTTACSALTGQKKEDDLSDFEVLSLAVLGLAVTPQTIPFSLMSGSDTVRCGGSFSLGATSGVTPQDLRFFISDVSMHTPDGRIVPVGLVQDGQWQYDTAALLDFEDRSSTCTVGTAGTNTSLRIASTVAPVYSGITFTLGLPQRLNKLQNTTSPAPFNTSGMYWAWASGYKFTKVEFTATSTSQTHIGSTNCAGASDPANCAKPFASTITITTGLNPASQSVVLDLNAMYQGYAATSGSACMPGAGNANCDAMMANIGLNSSTGVATGSQTAFKVQ